MVKEKATAVYIWIQLFLFTRTTSLKNVWLVMEALVSHAINFRFQLKLVRITTIIRVRTAGVREHVGGVKWSQFVLMWTFQSKFVRSLCFNLWMENTKCGKKMITRPTLIHHRSWDNNCGPLLTLKFFPLCCLVHGSFIIHLPRVLGH